MRPIFDQASIERLRVGLAALPEYPEKAAQDVSTDDVLSAVEGDLKRLAGGHWSVAKLADVMVNDLGYPGSKAVLKRKLAKLLVKRKAKVTKKGAGRIGRGACIRTDGVSPKRAPVVSPKTAPVVHSESPASVSPGVMPSTQVIRDGSSASTAPPAPEQRPVQPIDKPAGDNYQPHSAFRKRKF